VSVDPLRYYQSNLSDDGYPHEWHTPPRIPDLIRELRGHRCERCKHPYRKGDPRISPSGEWSPCDEECLHSLTLLRWTTDDDVSVSAAPPTPAGEILRAKKVMRVDAHWRILTVHHLDSDKANCRWWNLVALCQRCHLRMQRAVIMDREYYFEHSEWFKPYAAGFYAFKYQHQELTREEVMRGLEPLLKWEHRFTQEAIF